jgi:crotonobetaine/carnitine-CoA ligase
MSDAFADSRYGEAQERVSHLPLTVGELLDLRAHERPNARFLQFEDRSLTYAETAAGVNSLANGLAERGVGAGDRVAIMSSNRSEFTLLWLALARLGAVEVPINTAYKGRFLAYAIANSEVELIVVEDQFSAVLAAVLRQLDRVRTVIVLEPGESPTFTGVERVPFADLLSGDVSAPRASVLPSDTLAIAYTSGTTGASKGVMLTHGYFCHTGRNSVKYRDLRADDTLYNCMPLFHMNAQTLTTMPVLTAGGTVVLDRRFTASGFWERIRDVRATQFNFIGAMMSILWSQEPRSEDADNPARLAFGGPIPAAAFHGANERWGVTLLEGFGSTESGMVIWQPRTAPRQGAMGKPVPEFEVQLVDQHDHPVATGAPGEIVTRPRTPDSMMAGYYGMPERTVQAWRNLWFHTGDMARADEEGYLYFVDRKKDAIRRRGENISSAELESAILEHADVREAAVVAVPSELSEDEVKVFLVVVHDASFDHAAFVQWCETQLPRYMIPRYVEVLDALPKTATERIEKYKLRERAHTSTTWDREARGFVTTHAAV